jgi:hypothetical protein
LPEYTSTYYPEILSSIQELGELVDVLKKRNTDLQSRVLELESKVIELQNKQMQPGLFDGNDNQRIIVRQQVLDCISRIDQILDIS